jgi:signal peptidase I
MRFKQAKQPPPFGGIHPDDDLDIEVRRPKDASRRHLWHESRLLVRDLVFALMLLALIMVFIVQPVKVEGTSMLPHLHDGERIFVNKLVYYDDYRWAPKIQRGDVVVFWYPEDPSKSYIKRVIGLPGDTVEMRDGRVRVNGKELEEGYLDPELNRSRSNRPPVYVKQNYYFVMGDNRDNSSDSRIWGQVPKKYVYGKALFRYWPLSTLSLISHDAHYSTIPPGASYHRDAVNIPDRDEP